MTPPPFLPRGQTVMLYDGVCKLCNGWVRFVMAHDRNHCIRLATVQSTEGQALLAWANLSQDDFNTIALISHDRLSIRSDAFFDILSLLPMPWPILGVLRICPKPFRDWFYNRIAANRYRLFGRYERCQLPAPDHPGRFLGS